MGLVVLTVRAFAPVFRAGFIASHHAFGGLTCQLSRPCLGRSIATARLPADEAIVAAPDAELAAPLALDRLHRACHAAAPARSGIPGRTG